MTRICKVGPVRIGPGEPLAIIAGPCLFESLELGLTIAETLRDTCARLGLSYVFKASFDKANRSTSGSARGPGAEQGLAWLRSVRDTIGVPVTTDVHAPDQCEPAGASVDVLQIPAFLCRQTDLLVAAGEAGARHGCAVNVKKGQFLSPPEMRGPIGKLADVGCHNVMLTERGTFFGYGRLVNDFVGVCEMAGLDVQGGPPPVCFDCTHSTQRPGGVVTGGAREMAPMLARAAVASGVDAVFMECHPDPDHALSDAATMLNVTEVPALLDTLARIRQAVRA